MRTGLKNDQTKLKIKWYDIPFPVSDYTFSRAALLDRVRFDKDYIYLQLTYGRILAVPLQWFPSLKNAEPSEREKFEISKDRKMIIWDPDKCSINDELRIDDYLSLKT